MSSPFWICRPCLLRSMVRTVGRRQLRWQTNNAASTAAAATPPAPLPTTISPALLARAQNLSAEHSRLSAELAASFSQKTAKRVGELSAIANALASYRKASAALEELHGLLRDPAADAELRALAADDIDASTALLNTATRSLTAALVPVHPFAHLPCLLEIRPGAGGSEAALFAGDLLRMYVAYCGRHGLRASLLKYEDTAGVADPNGSDAPLHEAVLEVASPGAYGRLRCEAGVHRVQRVPATESKGRTHTSAASVLVLPSFSEEGAENEDANDPASDLYVDPKEVRVETMRARGAGGQHVNKTDSAIRLTHLPTGTVVSMQDSRSQQANRIKAWALLRAKLAQARRERREAEQVALRRSVVGVARMGRGDKVRTYNFGQQRVTDHRPGFSVHDLDDVLEGGESLDAVMDKVREWMVDAEVAGLLADEEAEAQAAAGKEK